MRSVNRKKVLFSGLLAFIATTLLSSASYADLKKIGVVGAANQTISAVDETKKERVLQLGHDIFFNDTIKTDGQGKAQLMFMDKSALTVGPNSTVSIDKFVYNPADASGELAMRGTKGTFRFIGGALSKTKEVKFQTPVGTIGIRGGIAIVEIAQNGATNATFLYGEKMTFQNMAGQTQQTNNSGFAISVATPTAAPSVPVAVDTSMLAAKVQVLGSENGQHGGATNVPTAKDINKTTITGETKPGDGANNPADNKNGQPGKPQDPNNKPANNQGANNGPVNGEGGNNPQNGPNGPATANGNPNSPRDPGQLTSDGGYIDANGEKHSAADLAAFRRAEANNNGNPNGNGATGTYAAGAPGSAAATNGTAPVYNNGAAGGAAPAYGNNGGYVAPMTGGAYANNTAPAPGTYAAGGAAYAPINNTGYVAPMTGAGGAVGGAYNTFNNMPPVTGAYNTYNPAPTTGYYGGTNYYAPPPNYVDPAAANAAAIAQAAAIAAAAAANNAAQTQYSMAGVPVLTTTPAYVGSNLVKLEMPANKHNAPYSNMSNLQYLSWGVWNTRGTPAQAAALDAAGDANKDFLVPYVSGQVTQTANIPNIQANAPVEATYTGNIFMNLFNSYTNTMTQGTSGFSAVVRAGAGSAMIKDVSFTVPSAGGTSVSTAITSTGSATITSPTATFGGLNISGGNYTSGTVNGALFGPAAQNIGGNATLTNSVDSVNGAGVFMGTRP